MMPGPVKERDDMSCHVDNLGLTGKGEEPLNGYRQEKKRIA